MTDLFTLENNSTSTPIELIAKEALPDWHERQDEFVQNWLGSLQYQEQAKLLIPNPDGTLKKVISVDKNDGIFFLAGQLPSELPQGEYRLESDDDEVRFQFAVSWALEIYQFDRYKRTEKSLPVLALKSEDEKRLVMDFVSAISLTRDLINTPANDMMPEHMSEVMQGLAKKFKADFSECVGDELLTQNYPAVHAVGRASASQPRLLDLRWGAPSAPKVTLVGKGVCFDSGGLNLKTGNFMRIMKKDMGGAAHVLGLAELIMAQKLPIRLRVLVPAVENAIAGNAFRPGDVISTRKGLSVEIDNTDAEGRLVLCDALCEADAEEPEVIIDFATLTGACRVALGTELPGFFCNDDHLAHDLFSSGQAVRDPVWQLPLHKPYNDMLKSQVADTLNSASTGMGGAITAALYLEKFISPETPWIHFDVMAWNDRRQAGRPIGGEAFGLRAVFHCLQKRYA